MKSPALIVKKLLTIVLPSLVTTSIALGQATEDYKKNTRQYSDNRKFLSVSGHFKVEDVGTIVVYSQPGIYKTANKTFYYFSLTQDSPIYPLKVRQLKRIFGEEKNEELLKELKANRRRLTKKEGRHLVVNELLIEYKS